MAVRYFVSSVDASVEFYVKQLGFVLLENMAPAIAMVKKGDDLLWLAGPPASASRPMSDGSVPKPGGWNRVVVSVEDIDSVVASLRAAGCSFRNEVVSGPGGRQILLDDPDGNPVELFEARSAGQ